MVQQVSIVLTNYQKAAKVIEGLDSVSRFAKSAGIDLPFPGGGKDEAIVKALEEMTGKLTAALDEIKGITTHANQLTVLEKKREKFDAWRERVEERLDELNSYDRVARDVDVSGRRIPIADWCEGENVEGHRKGVLDELGDLVSALDSWLEISVGGNTSLIDDWDKLMSSPAAADSLGISDETRYSAMLIWFQSICALLHTAVYVRNSALALYKTGSPNPKYVNVDTQLNELGQVGGRDDAGKARAPGRAWKLFDTKFSTFLEKTMLDDHENMHVRNSHDSSSHVSGFSEDHIFLGSGFRALPGANSYLAGLTIGFRGHAEGGQGIWVIDGTLVTINADGTQSVRRECTSERNDFRRQLKVLISGYPEALIERLHPGNKNRKFSYAHGAECYNAGGAVLGTGMIDVPVADPGWHSVATGFAVENHHGAWVIALQYGQMTIGLDGKIRIEPHPKMPWDGPLAAPRHLTDTYRLADDVDQLYRGAAETHSLMPITNATFQRVKYHLNIRVSCAPRLYQLDVFQPTCLKAYSAPNPPRSAQPRGPTNSSPSRSSEPPAPAVPTPSMPAT
jgi:hypothetical protein